MRFFVVHAHAQHHVAFGQERVVVVAEATGLGGAARGIVFGIKIKNNFFALKIRQFNGVSVLVFGLERGGWIVYLQHFVSF